MVMPVSMSLISQSFGFESALDLIGVVIGVNATMFLVFTVIRSRNAQKEEEARLPLSENSNELQRDEEAEETSLIKFE